MAESTLTIEVDVSPTNAWSSLKDPKRWAHLMPGDAGIEAVNPTTYHWKIKRNLGFINKTVLAEIQVTEEDELNKKVSFDIKGLSDPFKGHGEVHLEEALKGMLMHVSFKFRALGPMGPMINPVLKQQLPKIMNSFAVNLAEWITDATSRGDPA